VNKCSIGKDQDVASAEIGKIRSTFAGSIRNFVYVSFRVIWQLSDNLVRSSPSP